MTSIQMQNEAFKVEWQEAFASIYGEANTELVKLTNKAWDDWCYFTEENGLTHPTVQLKAG